MYAFIRGFVSILVLTCGLGSTTAYAQDERVKECVAKASAIHAGMTRAEIESRMSYDAGVHGVTNVTFYFPLPEGKSAEQACMLNIDFRTAAHRMLLVYKIQKI